MEGGAVGVIGDTRNSPTWANSAFARGLFDATWPDLLPGDGGNTSIRRLGDILNYGKVYLVGQVFVPQSAGSVSLAAALTDVTLYHVYGDPTMAMWTKYPWQVALPGFADDFKVIEAGLWEISLSRQRRHDHAVAGRDAGRARPCGQRRGADGAASKTSIPKRPTSCRPACPGPSAQRWPCPTPPAAPRRRAAAASAAPPAISS